MGSMQATITATILGLAAQMKLGGIFKRKSAKGLLLNWLNVLPQAFMHGLKKDGLTSGNAPTIPLAYILEWKWPVPLIQFYFTLVSLNLY